MHHNLILLLREYYNHEPCPIPQKLTSLSVRICVATPIKLICQ